MDDRKPSGPKSLATSSNIPPKKKRSSPLSTAFETDHLNPPEVSNNQDLLAVDAFTAGIHFDEISLQAWENNDEILDLVVPIWINLKEAEEGCEREIEFVRTIRSKTSKIPSRQKVRLIVRIPGGSSSETRVKIPGQGEINGGKSGDLIIKVELKK